MYIILYSIQINVFEIICSMIIENIIIVIIFKEDSCYNTSTTYKIICSNNTHVYRIVLIRHRQQCTARQHQKYIHYSI